MAGLVQDVTDEAFEGDVMKNSKPTLVDFWAPWCGPCKAIAPTVEELAGQFQGKVNVRKMNIDDHPRAAGRYGIRAIPTLILFKGGQPVDQITGAVSKAKIEDMMKRHA